MEASPDQFFQASPGGYYNTQFTPEKPKASDHFIIEDLLDFPTDDSVTAVDGGASLEAATNIVMAAGNSSTDSASTVTAVDSCNSSLCGDGEPHFTREMVSRSFADTQFSNDLCVPYDDLAELEWLSNFVEESFSSEDLQKLQLISGVKTRPYLASEASHQFQAEANRNNPIFNPDMSVPGKARTKRSRAAPCNWTSRLLVLSPMAPVVASSESESDITSSTTVKKAAVKAPSKKKEVIYDDNGGPMNNRDGRKCLHCATDKTPQWRTGPMGPKTLCNACGVRYKSGRLVPEYRPAASPTFVLTKHSNSHRKVLELRRQKEMQRAHHQQQQFIQHQNMMFDVPGGDEYLIHQHIGSDYRQLI